MDFAAWFEAYRGRTLAHVRRAEQHAAHRPRADGARTRRHRRRHQQRVRPEHADGLHGLDGRDHQKPTRERADPAAHRPARHRLSLFGAGEARRASDDVPPAREPRPAPGQTDARHRAAPDRPALAPRRLRQLGRDRDVRRRHRRAALRQHGDARTSRDGAARLRARRRARRPIRFAIRTTNCPDLVRACSATIRATTSVAGRAGFLRRPGRPTRWRCSTR